MSGSGLYKGAVHHFLKLSMRVHALQPAGAGWAYLQLRFTVAVLRLAMRNDMHYHIRWAHSKIDWERFNTREEAEEAARQLARPGETFTLEHVDDEACMQCVNLCKRASANDKIGDAEADS